MEILREVEKYLAAKAMPPTRFGRLALRDPRMVYDMRRGRQPGPRTVARLRAFMRGDGQ